MRTFTLIAFLLIGLSGFAQPYKTIKVYKPYKWMIGVHMSVIEDDGNKLGNPFDVEHTWHYLNYPTRLTVDRYFKFGWSMEGAISYNSYLESVRVDDTVGITGTNFSFDLCGKYSFYNLYAPRFRWIEPYLNFGVSYTYRDAIEEQHIPSVVLGGGLNIWVFKQVGIQISSRAKLAAYPFFWDSHASYFQHTAGLVYRTKETRVNRQDRSKHHKWTKQTTKYKRKGGH
ncbi:MAG: hypothetical protein EP333_10755 [Bacteroidetes bacterium]|nr:MAG: hypothetical protein EP333_10755 [Bacteroidota bacterium]